MVVTAHSSTAVPLLARSEPSILVGAHDALTAIEIERHGFDGVWVSSYTTSATAGVPDASLLSIKEILDKAEAICHAVSIPVIVDGDSGHGGPAQIDHFVRRAQRLGVAGICIEDNPFPKQSSLYADASVSLASPLEHAGRIAAAKAAARSGSFLVIARTEALVRDLGLEEALQRAELYVAAGADAILIHSTSPSGADVFAFARRWKSSVPLVVVPTTYDRVSVAELAQAGIKVVIFANQPLRLAVKAIDQGLSTLRREGRASVLRESMVPTRTIDDLVNEPEIRRLEAYYGEFRPPLDVQPR